MQMREIINLFERSQTSVGVCYHGTSSKFLPSIKSKGLLAEPEDRVYDGDFVAYPGVYFSDTFSVAAYRASLAVEKFGGKGIVLVCEPEGATAGDEDAFQEFLESLDEEDEEDEDEDEDENSEENYRDPRSAIKQSFIRYFDTDPPSEVFSLILALENGSIKMHDARYREIVDRIMRLVGDSPSMGYHQARDFRVIDGARVEHIKAIVQLIGRVDDPGSLNVRYKTISGTFKG